MAQMQSSTSGLPQPLSDVTYDIVTELHQSGRATSILKTYIDDASKANDAEAARVFEQIRQDKLRHCDMLRDLVKDEVKQGRF